jgi:enterochelin esterase family protein
MPPIVAIFIDSTETREEELSCNDTFGDIIVNELIPWVKDNYNISNIAEESIIGGISLGGLTAAYLGLKHSGVFGNILSQSGSYWYKPDNYEGSEVDCWLSTQFKKIEKLPLKFYLNVGILEHKERMVDTNIILRDVLISKGYTVDFEKFKSGHDYLCWGETLANGLISLVGYK